MALNLNRFRPGPIVCFRQPRSLLPLARLPLRPRRLRLRRRRTPDAGATHMARGLGAMSGRRGACVEASRLADHRRALAKAGHPGIRRDNASSTRMIHPLLGDSPFPAALVRMEICRPTIFPLALHLSGSDLGTPLPCRDVPRCLAPFRFAGVSAAAAHRRSEIAATTVAAISRRLKRPGASATFEGPLSMPLSVSREPMACQP
jgi:hypothetical protein